MSIGIRVVGSALLFIVLVTSGLVAKAASGPPADVYPFIAEIGPPTAHAKIGGDQRFERVITFGRNASGELVVTSLQVLGLSGTPKIPAATIGVMIAHYDGQCDAPHANDDYAASQGLLDYVIASSGDTIWEIEPLKGINAVRTVSGVDRFGAWETFQKDPEQYQTYKCDMAGR